MVQGTFPEDSSSDIRHLRVQAVSWNNNVFLRAVFFCVEYLGEEVSRTVWL